MSTSTGAFGLAATSRKKSSRKVISRHLLGSAAVAGLVLGCAWTVYTNVLGASIYPSVNSAALETPVIKRTAAVATRPATPAFNDVFASLPAAPPAISAPATVPTSIMFNERFAASAPQGQAPSPKLAEASPSVEALKATVVSKPVDAPKFADAPRLADASRKADAPKLAEAPKKEAAAPAASTQIALNSPTAPVEARPTAKAPGNSVRDMAERAKAAVMSIASFDRPSIVEKLWGKQSSQASLLSYASADVSATGSLPDTRAQNPMLGGSPPYDRQTAVYDISARTVYLPDGTKLEAHSGLGSKLDDPRSSHIRMMGVTPPHIYELTPREALFHGVPALRLTPVGGEDKIFGRSGLLAHTYMLGPNGDSNGCVSFKDYYAFLNAYRNKGIKRLAVLARVE